MKLLLATPLIAALAFTGATATTQTTSSTQVSTSTDVKDGVVTHERKVVRTTKRKTRHPKKILGVKVGHKTARTKVVRKTTTSSDGDMSTSVKTTH